MRIDLSSPVRRRAFLIGCSAVLLFSWLLCCQSLAEYRLDSDNNFVRLNRAARLQPLNAETEERLGLFYMAPSLGDFAAAEVHLKRAVSINPHSSKMWLELADVYEAKGEDANHDNAVRRALAIDPTGIDAQWRAANLFLSTDLDRGLKLLRAVLENDAGYASTVTSLALFASNNDMDKAMLAIPQTMEARLQLMHYLVDRNQAEAADHVWPTALAASGALKPRDAFFYIDSLLERHQPFKAHQVWIALAQRDPALRLDSVNLVTNGDFEGDLLNGGFGWRYVPASGVTASLDTSTFHGGTRSLGLQVDGENLADFGFSELILVQPGAHYRLSAWMHAEDLEAAHGVSFSVSDAYSHSRLLLTDEALGSFPWREVDGDFTAPAGTQIVKISLARSPANGRIRGKLWLDDVQIEGLQIEGLQIERLQIEKSEIEKIGIEKVETK